MPFVRFERYKYLNRFRGRLVFSYEVGANRREWGRNERCDVGWGRGVLCGLARPLERALALDWAGVRSRGRD